MALASGSRLGPFEILGPAGTGGMGEVYRARDTRLDRVVAIKVLPAETGADPQLRRALLQEAQAVAALSHPHICVLHDVGREDGLDFLVMEYVDGETLRSRLKRGPLSLAEALRVAAEIGEALAAAHRAGVVHRDLKPSNVMLTRGGVKLLDFGLAKRDPVPLAEAAGAREAATLTQPGTVRGTLLYMAPEQLEGRAVDARTDLFALGAVLHEMITGSPAFRGDSTPTIIAAILGPPPPAPSSLRAGVPRSIDRFVAACLERDPATAGRARSTSSARCGGRALTSRRRPAPPRAAAGRPGVRTRRGRPSSGSRSSLPGPDVGAPARRLPRRTPGPSSC